VHKYKAYSQMGHHPTYLVLTCHGLSILLTLTLFVLWIFADYTNTAFSFNDFALIANRFNWCSNLH